ncbi:hypothetical protein [Brevundimonas sp. UBA7664]|uniref:hypothetical protein n=1 Tax=Brevundimonas sp. UBA7664 TaxID=1946141 RepID=UPI0025B88F76|nr:hypothetical protein [Brevundimonas sp. UBA7664]
MNDDNDLLFGLDDLDGYKRGEKPHGWLEKQKEALLERFSAQSAGFQKLLMSAAPHTARRLHKRL